MIKKFENFSDSESITVEELENKKKFMFDSFKEDPDMSHISDEDLKIVVDTFYKIKLKDGSLKLI